jgi:hypothetical protein
VKRGKVTGEPTAIIYDSENERLVSDFQCP